MALSGKCLCGAVGYVAESDPVFSGNCYCKDCRRESGTGHTTAVAVPEPSLTVTGKTSQYVKSTDRGTTLTTVFCPICATTLYARPSTTPGMVLIRAGALDDDSGVDPKFNLFAPQAPRWDKADPALMAFDGMPPSRS